MSEDLAKRVQDLEQALDEALRSLHHLHRQLADQQFLEQHLASTEQISNVQQQAIVQLQSQIAEKQRLIAHQQQQLEAYQSPASGPRGVDEFGEIGSTRPSVSLPEEARDRSDRTAARIEELEAELARLLTHQAMLQQACQELEMGRDQQQTRIGELEAQLTDAQEQVLHQVQQAHEYETAVQHWKDRYAQHRYLLLQLIAAIETTINPIPTEVIEALRALQSDVTTQESNAPETISSGSRPPEPKLDLPEFLLRRRYKPRR